jgi:uncharacterized protein YqgQ
LGEANRYISELRAKLMEAEDYIRSAEVFIREQEQTLKKS